MTDALQMMIKALALEIAAIRKTGATTEIELRGGEYVRRAGEAWLYRFLVTKELTLSDDTPVKVVVGEHTIQGVVASFEKSILMIALSKDLGPKIAEAKLVIDNTFLLERLKQRLEEVYSGSADFCRPAAERAIGELPAVSGDAEPDPRVTAYGKLNAKQLSAVGRSLGSNTTFVWGPPGTGKTTTLAAIGGDAEPDPRVTAHGKLNAKQLSAVRRSLGSSTTFVWGPPGTGKTTTLAAIVEAHYRKGCSVLLVSNTNLAVDTALEAVAERLKDERDFEQGLVLRHGTLVKEELRQKFGPYVILDEIVARLAAPLRHERDELIREEQERTKAEGALRAALNVLKQFAAAQNRLEEQKRARAGVASAIEASRQQALQQRDRVRRLSADLERARSMSSFRRFFSGLHPERLEQLRAIAEQEAKAAEAEADALVAQLTKLDEELKTRHLEVEVLSAKTRGYPPLPEVQSRLDLVAARLRQIRDRIAEIGVQIEALKQNIIGRCRILATTVYRTYLGKKHDRNFDVVVIDEASMLMLPLVYYASGLARLSVTIAGDFRQLPPIVLSNETLAEEWLKRDVFHKVGIPELVQRRQPAPMLVQLDTQYRMREPICELINKLFYHDSPLKTAPEAGRIEPGERKFPLSEAPLLFVDTTPFRPWAALRAGTYSRYNLLHAVLVRNIVFCLAEAKFLPRAAHLNDAVGAVAPYSAQARLIHALLYERLGAQAVGIAATVHRFQGNEKRVMLVDLTGSYDLRLGKFLKATQLEEDGARLLNVALSRARQHIVLIGNFVYLRAKARECAFVRRLVDHFEEHGESLDVEALLRLAEREWIDGLRRELPIDLDLPEGAAGAFSESTFDRAFRTDLVHARQSIVIVSPVASKSGTARWVELLRAALGRGVSVRILTRPPQDYDGHARDEVAGVVQALRTLGATVELREDMHEALAILDEHILWHGSLDILAHCDTAESMLRMDSPAACQQLAGLLKLLEEREDEGASVSTATHPRCPKCGGPTIWKQGRKGIWFACEDENCGGTADGRRRTFPQAAGETAGWRVGRRVGRRRR